MRKRDDARATVRAKSQITLPRPVVDALGVQEGDIIIFAWQEDPSRPLVEVRPLRRSYAGVAAGAYGRPDAFIAGEREAWER